MAEAKIPEVFKNSTMAERKAAREKAKGTKQVETAENKAVKTK